MKATVAQFLLQSTLSRRQTSCSRAEKREEGSSTHGRANGHRRTTRGQSNTPSTGPTRPSHCKITSKTSYQSSRQNGQFRFSGKPRLDESGDTVSPCGAFTNSMDQLGATIIYRLPPSGTEGPILSTRASEFESLCGMDLLISDLRDVIQTVQVTACSGKSILQAKTVPMEDAQVEKSRSTSSCGARSIPVHAWRPLFSFLSLSPPCFTLERPRASLLEKTSLPSEKQSRVLTVSTLFTRCRRTDSVPLSTRTAQMLSPEKDRHEEVGAFSWANDKIVFSAEMPDMKGASPYNGLEKLTKSADRERYEMCQEPHTAGRKPCHF